MCRFISFSLFCCVFISCASTISYDEYALAEVAIGAAEKVQARQLSSNTFLKAQSYLRQGIVEFKNKDYDKARSYFVKSKKLAESAELVSHIKKSSQGGMLY